MNRRDFLKKCALGIGGFVLSSNTLEVRISTKHPNIIVMMADDLGFECLSCYGSASYQTPVLDALANTGIRFKHGYSQPLCTPSRVQIMTGRYNNRNYVRFGVLDPKEKTFAHILKKVGYTTCVTGKWQLYSAGDGTYADKAGFDEYCLWNLEDRGSRYEDPTYRKNGVLYENMVGEYGPDVFCNFITDFIERNKTRPFFVYYPMCLTHGPFCPTPDSEDWGQKGLKDEKYFPDMVNYTDKVIGRIARKLDELGLREKTLLLFTGDNGTPRSITSQLKDGSSIDGGKGHTTDAGTHVAFIANWKGTTPAGKVSTDLVDFSDVLVTIAEIAGASLPANRIIDGRSFLPQLRGQPGNPRDWIYCYYDARQSSNKWPLSIFAREKRWKLYGNGECERAGNLYDVPADPLEENPIEPGQGGSEAEEARARLQAVLDSME